MLNTEFVDFVRSNAARVDTYKLGGDGSDGKCDCIGLIIGALRLAGVSWGGTHGSNYAARSKMRTFAPVGSADDLTVGHLVYKHRAPDASGYALPSTYKNSQDRNDYYHVGVVTGVSPLEITHCTSVKGGIKTDKALGAWSHYGELEGVEYGDAAMPELVPYTVTGGKLALRTGAGTEHKVQLYIPDKAQVEAAPRADNWSYVRYSGRTGYSMSKYLTPVQHAPTLEERVAALEAWRKSVEEVS